MSYWFLSVLATFLRLFPVPWVLALGRWGGRLLFLLDRSHARLAISHLRLAFPDRSLKDLQKIARQHFINLGEGAVEFLYYRKASLNYCLAHVEGVHTEVCHEVLRRGKGMIYLTAHYGNWELLGIFGYALMRQYEICAIGRASSSPGVDRFVREIREVSGLKILPKKGALRDVLRYLRHGGVASFLADQIAGSDGIPVQFFGRMTMAVATPAALSLRTGAPIVPVFIERKSAGHHRVIYCDPIEPVRTEDLEADVRRMTQAGMDKLEEFIRRRPDHWFWLHKRWKSKRAKKCFQSVSRIVVFLPHWIGDAVMSLPALAGLRKLFPNAHLAVAVPQGLEALVRGIPYVDEKIGYGWTPQGFGFLDRCRFIGRLAQGDYDMAVLFVNSFDSAVLAACAGISHRVGTADHGRGMLLTHALTADDAAKLHQTQRYCRIVASLGDVPPAEPPDFSASPEDIAWARKILSPAVGKTRVGIHPGAAYGPAKRWFPERFVQLGMTLSVECGMQVVFLGSDKEKDALEPYWKGWDFSRIDAMGKTDLGQLIALISQLDVLVCNDSGPMHLAGLVRTPVVAIFGSTDPEETAPQGDHRIVRKVVGCSPCFNRECRNKDHPLECLDRVDVPDVLREIKAVVSAGEKKGSDPGLAG